MSCCFNYLVKRGGLNFPYFESGFCCLGFRENDLVAMFCFSAFVAVTGMFLCSFMFMIMPLVFMVVSLMFVIMSCVSLRCGVSVFIL